MANALNLDPGDYTGTYKLIGGTPVLDFANLVSYRGTGREHDWLDPISNVHRWVDAIGLPADPQADIDALRDFRELLARIFLATADHESPDAGDVDRLGAVAGDAATRRRLHFPEGAQSATWTDGGLSLVDALALPAAELLMSADALRRVSACGECRWLYLDTTRNHTRRWCDPTDCGNRARQRRHYHRHRPARYELRQTTEGAGDR